MKGVKINFSEQELDELYEWVDKFTLSRPKKNIARDFSDGILIAEMINELHPKMVNTRTLVKSLNTKIKKGNWETLNSNFRGDFFTREGVRQNGV